MSFIFSDAEFLYPLILLIVLIIIGIIRKVFGKKNALNHWNILIQDLKYSPKTFYEQIEEALKKEGLGDLRFSDKKMRQGSIISQNRIYKKVKWKEYSYFICAAPFADSFFVSYRMSVKHPFFISLVAGVPFLGKYLVRWFFPLTWYKEDSINMFHSLMHQSIIEVINAVSEEQGIERIPEAKATVDTRNIFKR